MSVSCGLSSIPRESEEFVALYVILDGQEITNYEVCYVKGRNRPLTWTPATNVDARYGVMLQDLSPGEWTIFVRVLGSIVEEVTSFMVT